MRNNEECVLVCVCACMCVVSVGADARDGKQVATMARKALSP